MLHNYYTFLFQFVKQNYLQNIKNEYNKCVTNYYTKTEEFLCR